MYVTRPVSHLQKFPELLEEVPDGPNSGFLVIQDVEHVRYSCFGCCHDTNLKQLPFPQDKEFTLEHGDSTSDKLLFIPLLNRPLSSNLYYAIAAQHAHIGKAWTCSREDDMQSTWGVSFISEAEPQPLDPANIYQHFEIVPRGAYSFHAKSVAADGFPPAFLRQKGWWVYPRTPHNFRLDDVAHGLDFGLRARLPEQESPASTVVGRWYTPFTFVKERSLREQAIRSMYYEVTLERRWESVLKTDDRSVEGNLVKIDVVVEREEVFVGGKKGAWNEEMAMDGVVWFSPIGGGEGVGLRVELVERMKWEEERGGWRRGEEREVWINKEEEFHGGGGGGWSEFGFYVLVERFNFRRMDGSLALAYDFKHLHVMKTKWEKITSY